MKKICKKSDWLLVVPICLSLLIGCAGLQTAKTVQAQQEMAACPNCGMILKKWAHTNHEFTNSEGHFRTCSIHCVADMNKKSGEEPRDVRVALHLHPEEMIPAEKAVYVIGSKDPGTMTKVSKLAFKSRADAEKFVAQKGGKIATFSEALAAATAELPKAKPMLQAKRKKMGKIVEPSDQDRCPICNMFPARYPKNNAQLITADGKRFHFCSTQCLFEFLQNPQKYGAGEIKIGPIWVHDHTSGRYIFGKNAYYVVGSEVLGPMGYEAIPFDLKSDAMGFAKDKGGQVLKFDKVTPAKIKTK
jgi:copper chaperone NosL